ncbi:translocation/assembly module TamB domain-containing protein [Dyella sp. KRB-257]|uniref:translocation/assembly module TamB domain-containing protein n=1 Tax=Dyella sp. KRB-257 TaxID=3400915 RepID=UPI003C03EBF3
MTDAATPSTVGRRRWPRRLALGLLAVIALLGAAGFWLLGTGAGLRFALARAASASGGALQVDQAAGRLIGPLTLRELRYRDASGLDVRVAQAQLDLAVWPLLRRQLHLLDLQADGMAVALAPAAPPTASKSRFSLQPPLDIVIDRAHVGRVRITRPDRDGKAQPVFASDRLDLAGAWTRDGLRLRQLDLRGPDGSVQLTGELAIGGDYRGRSDGRFDWSVARVNYAGAFQARSDGRQAQLTLTLTRPAAATLKLSLAPSGDYPWTATLDAPRFDPAPLLGPDSTLTALAASLRARGDRRGGSVEGRVDLDDYTVRLQPLRARFSDNFGTLQLEQLTLSSPQIPGQLDASGLVQLSAAPVSAALVLRWKGVTLPAALVGQPLASEGHLSVKGSAARYHAGGELALGPPGQTAQLALDLDGTPRQIALHTLRLVQAKGQLDASGTLTLQPALAWQGEATAERFDPGQLFAGWSGALDADLASTGARQAQGLDATLELRRLAGTLRQRPVRGRGRLHLSPAQVLDGMLELASGGSTVRLAAKPGASNDARLTLAIASLADWLPDAGGRLDGHLAIRGKIPRLSVNGTLQGQRLSWQQQHLDALRLIVGVPDIHAPSGKLDVDGRGLRVAGGLAFDRLHLLAEGSQATHRLALQADGRQLSINLALDGSLKNGAWSGTLGRLDLAPQGLPRWRLQQPTALGYRDGAASLGELCLGAGDPLLCASGRRDKGGNLDASYRLRALPLALILNAAGMADLPLRADGTLDGDGQLRRSASGALSGHAAIRSDAGTVTYTDHADQPLLAYRQFALQARLTPGDQRATVHAELDHDGRLDGQLRMHGPAQTLDGTLDLRLDQLAAVELLTSELANVKGALAGHVVIGGTLGHPAVSGNARVDGFAAEVPSAGLKLGDGRLTLTSADARTLQIDGQVHSGEGTLAIRGSAGLADGGTAELTLKGSRFTAADIPAARVVVSPELVVRQGTQGVDVTGRVALDSADIDLARLPGAGATRASPDVVVMDEQTQQAKAKALPISATVAVELGPRTHVVGMGLDGKLRGQLVVRERPGQATTGQGQVDVAGTYRAYGQNLTIEQGQLLFASTPIDNPRLNLRAVRKLHPNATVDEGQKVGLYIAGTAQRPVLTVFSQPAMEQSDALSYLITGKPLSEVRGGEGSMVNSAAQALGSAGGDLLARRIGAQLGMDDIGVSSNQALGGSSAFTVGKYLSPRLYLSYGVGLFQPGQVITLRYRLSQRWNFEAQNATDFSRASFNYRLER